MVAALRQANEGFAKVIASRGGLEDPRTDLAAELAALTGSGWAASGRAWSWSTSCTWRRCGARRCARSPPSGARTSPRCCPAVRTR